MKSFKTLQLNTPDIATKLAYDPQSESLLVSGQKLSMISENSHQDISLNKSPAVESLPKEKISLDQPYLRFTSNNQPNISLSHSGILIF